MNSTYDDRPETTPPMCHTNPKDPGTHEIFGLHVMTFFDPPVGTPMHWKHNILWHKLDYSSCIKAPPLSLCLPLSLCGLSFHLSCPIRNSGLAQAMDRTSKLPASARVISQLCLLSFQSMVSSSRPWELNSLKLIHIMKGGERKFPGKRGKQLINTNLWCSSGLSTHRQPIYSVLRIQTMWRCSKDSCACNNCIINTLHDQVREQ